MGIAKQFLNQLYTWFERKQLKYVELTVHPKNEDAKKAWSKYRFKEYMSKQRKKLNNI